MSHVFYSQILVTLKASQNYDFVKVGYESGYTDSYAPETVSGRDIQTMVYVSQ